MITPSFAPVFASFWSMIPISTLLAHGQDGETWISPVGIPFAELSYRMRVICSWA
jgi:hypothetical protein